MTTTGMSPQAMATLLGEPNIRLLENCARVLGISRLQGLVAQVIEQESQGGMLRADGQGRRTPGGALFTLVRSQLNGRQRYRLFGSSGTGTPTPPPQPCTWSDVTQMIEGLAHGEIGGGTVSIKLVGRPMTIQTQKSAVCFQLRSTLPPSLPKGLPPVPQQTPILWTVLVDLKQWNRVKEQFRADPEDKLIIEGYPVIDGTRHLILAQSCKSIAMEKAQRAKQQAASQGNNSSSPSS